jgi:Serine dehydrogenase proteinase
MEAPSPVPPDFGWGSDYACRRRDCAWRVLGCLARSIHRSLGPPAASIIKALNSKPIEGVFDLTLILADVAEKALAQVKQGQ